MKTSGYPSSWGSSPPEIFLPFPNLVTDRRLLNAKSTNEEKINLLITILKTKGFEGLADANLLCGPTDYFDGVPTIGMLTALQIGNENFY